MRQDYGTSLLGAEKNSAWDNLRRPPKDEVLEEVIARAIQEIESVFAESGGKFAVENKAATGAAA